MTEETPAPALETPTDSLITDTAAPLDFASGKPEGFPDDFWNAEKNTPEVDKLYKEFQNRDKIAKDLRVKLSKGEFTGKAPEDIKEYVVELTDAQKPFVQDGDPLFEAARQAAKDAGLPKEAFSKFMQPIVSKIVELNAIQSAPMSPEDIEAVRTAEIEKLGPSGHKIVGAIGSFVKQLTDGGTFSAGESKAVLAAINNAEVARAFNKLRMMSGGQDQVPLDLPVDTLASKSDIETKMAQAMGNNNEAEYNKYANMLSKISM